MLLRCCFYSPSILVLYNDVTIALNNGHEHGTCPRQEHDQDRTVSIDMNRTRILRRVHGHLHGHISTDTNTETFHEHDHGHGYGDR